jgi:rhodanese-related sulfurtransferase
MSDPIINSATLDLWLREPGELAVLDVRPEVEFVQHGAPLFASNLPADQVLQRITTRVPRRGVRLVLVDGGNGSSVQLTRDLRARGYNDAHYLKGGLPGWVDSGFQSTFSVSAPQFSTQVWEKFGTPAVQATELHELYQSGADVVVLDSRTVEEYARGHVPRAISVPGGELVQRFADLVPSPETLVLVSCAGNPRGVIGAQTLRNARVPNRVAVLEEGTKGWQKAGLELEVGLQRTFGPVSSKAAQLGDRWATRLEREFAVKSIDATAVARWVSEGDHITTYLLDVRTPQEYEEWHIPGSVSAPGGQLILGTLRYVAVRGARLVLIDDTGIRAITTAHWLRQRGWEARVHRLEAASDTLVPGEQQGVGDVAGRSVDPTYPARPGA